MLNLLFTNKTLNSQKKKEILESEYHIPTDREGLGKELDLMCNLSGYIYEEGIEEGRVQGRAEGHSAGRAEGRAEAETGILTAIRLIKEGNTDDEEIIAKTGISQKILGQLKEQLLDSSATV